MKDWIKTGVVLSAIAIGAPAMGGGADGGGGDASHEADTMWFGNETVGPVKYCLQMDRSFGATETEAQEAFSAALQTWKEYSRTHEVHMGQENYIKLPVCDGSEALTVYLGGSSPKIELAKKAYIAPLAFAVREFFDAQYAWGKGYIWIASASETLGASTGDLQAPDWKKPFLLQAILTHELGHILGCTHQSGTVMDTALPVTIASSDLLDPVRKTIVEVDQKKELLVKWTGKKQYRGTLPSSSAAGTFERFAGRRLAGQAHATLEITHFSGREPQVKLMLSDSLGRETVPLVWLSQGPTFALGNGHFRGPRISQVPVRETHTLPDGSTKTITTMVKEQRWSVEQSVGFAADLIARTKDGTALSATLAFNAKGANPVNITYLDKAGRVELFRSSAR